MNLTTLEKRVRTLETLCTRVRQKEQGTPTSGQQMNIETPTWVNEVEELTQKARLITDQAMMADDLGKALAAIRTRCCILELSAKLSGHLDERNSTNILNLNLDSETARRIAETYLESCRVLEVESK